MAGDRSPNRSVLFGSAITLTLIAVTVLVFFIGDIVRGARPTIELVIVADHAGTLRKGSPVWIAGREVGAVTGIGLRPARTDSTERIAIHAVVPKRYATHIRIDSEVRMTSRRLIGDPALDIMPGSARLAPVRDRDTLRLRRAGTLEGLTQQAEKLSFTFRDMFRELDTLRLPVARMDRDMARLSDGLSASLVEFRELVRVVDEGAFLTLSGPEWHRLVDQLNASGRQLGEALRGATERARAAGNEARPALERLSARADTINAVLADIRGRVAAGGGGLLIRAQRDSAITRHLHEVQAQLDTLIQETKKNPLRFWL